MKQYIDKSAVVAEIEKRKLEWDYQSSVEALQKSEVYKEILSLIDTLEVKEVDNELKGIEKEVAEGCVNAIDRKRIPITLKGEVKAAFKNEFNTMWQVIEGIKFANVAKYIIERLCLHFAAWGVYNLKGYCSISSEEKQKMDIIAKGVKEVNLENEITQFLDTYFPNAKLGHKLSLRRTAKHFFELGIKVKGE